MNEHKNLSHQDKQFLLEVARKTLHSYLSGNKTPEFKSISEAVLEKRPAFVTYRVKHSNQLRGCRGETVAKHSLIESVKKMSIASAVDDPRFDPITLEELADIFIEINALTPIYPINMEDIVIGKHGLMIVTDFHAGLLLPAVPVSYKWDKETYLDQLCLKAGLPRNTWKERKVELYAFESEEWAEEY